MSNEQTKPKIPAALLYDKAENTIFGAVNLAAQEIPFYMIEGMLVNILHQVREQARAEKANAARLYEKELAEYEAAEKEAESEGE